MLDYIFALFAGFAVGRIGHIFGGQISWVPHHWIFGLGIIFIGLVLIFIKRLRYFGVILFLFGIGFFISDFRDFLLMRVWELDDVSIIRFWGVD